VVFFKNEKFGLGISGGLYPLDIDSGLCIENWNCTDLQAV